MSKGVVLTRFSHPAISLWTANHLFLPPQCQLLSLLLWQYLRKAIESRHLTHGLREKADISGKAWRQEQAGGHNHICHRNSETWMLVLSWLSPFYLIFHFYSFWDPMGLCQPHSGLIFPSPMNLSGTLWNSLEHTWTPSGVKVKTNQDSHLQPGSSAISETSWPLFSPPTALKPQLISICLS